MKTGKGLEIADTPWARAIPARRCAGLILKKIVADEPVSRIGIFLTQTNNLFRISEKIYISDVGGRVFVTEVLFSGMFLTSFLWNPSVNLEGFRLDEKPCIIRFAIGFISGSKDIGRHDRQDAHTRWWKGRGKNRRRYRCNPGEKKRGPSMQPG